jgi:VWFA-related protein
MNLHPKLSARLALRSGPLRRPAVSAILNLLRAPSAAVVAAAILAIAFHAQTPSGVQSSSFGRTSSGSVGPAGQSPQAQTLPEQQPPRFRLEANFVRVDAYVMKDGKPLDGLGPDDFEIFEDGVPQTIETFEHVVVRPAGFQEERMEPRTVSESRQMAADPRARLFVLFLDTHHVRPESAHRIRPALSSLLQRTIGQDDLIAVMTPGMAISELSFARKTAAIDDLLSRPFHWAERGLKHLSDPVERMYVRCYGEGPAFQLIERRRERRTLDAIQDLVRHLRGVREERKAILTITEGWVLFPAIPAATRIYVGPGGKPTMIDLRNALAAEYAACEADRGMLAALDNEQHFRRILEEANRANASFYPIDPRGLPAFDTEFGDPTPVLDVVADHAQLKARLEALRVLALNTDGLAVLNSNDILSGMTRAVEDLTSYYLIGYLSTNGKLDGRFRSIRVRVKQPGVSVRARRGYRAATEDEVAAAIAARPPVTLGAEASALTAAIDGLAAVRSGNPLHLMAAWLRTGETLDGAASASDRMWIAAELDVTAKRSVEWKKGASADIVVLRRDGPIVGRRSADLDPATGTLLVEMSGIDLLPGDYDVRVRMQATGGDTQLTEFLSLTVTEKPGSNVASGQLLLSRRGPSSGGRFVPAADPRFRRPEMLRVELPSQSRLDEAHARLLDRAGQPMKLPIGVSRNEADEGAVTWVVAELALAPLAPGDYVLELEVAYQSRRQKVLQAFRIVP